MLSEIEEHQRNYYDLHPNEQTILDRSDYEPPAPTRAQPERTRRAPARTVYHVYHLFRPSVDHFNCVLGLEELQKQSWATLAATQLLLPDFAELPAAVSVC